jgi:alpha-L-fucosidase
MVMRDWRMMAGVGVAVSAAAVLAAAAGTPVRPDSVKAAGISPEVARQLAITDNALTGYDMAPETTLPVVEAAVKAIPTPLPGGPVKPTWDSLKEHYEVPQWFVEAKFGIFMHWGLYAVPAYHNEWYEKFMYNGGGLRWHTEHFGPPATFGYKDFIPRFTAAKWDPDAWALLFKQAGAKYVIPTAQHHDNFSLWNSQANPVNAVNMGPHRDLIGDLAKAVRKQGLKFGVSNHGIEAFEFVQPSSALVNELKAKQAVLFDTKWA